LAGPAGALAGPGIDKYGRAAYQNILRASSKSPDVVKKYANSLNSAMKAGPASLITTHQFLRKKYPDYAEATNEE
jgi:hypothetical protein